MARSGRAVGLPLAQRIAAAGFALAQRVPVRSDLQSDRRAYKDLQSA